MAQRTGQTRPGGRTARTAAAVHDAVRALAAEGVVKDIQVADVAARAGVHPVTIYRRWGSAAALVLEVATADLQDRSPVPHTGDLRQDLLSYTRGADAGIQRPGGLAYLRAIMAAVDDPGTGASQALDLLGARLGAFDDMLAAAGVEDRITALDVVNGILAPLYLRALLFNGHRCTDAELERLVENVVLLAQRPGPATPSSP